MRKETFRALKMVLYMESIPDEQFDITLWVTRLGGKAYNAFLKSRSECGTVCCFIGHLPLAFPEHFLHKTHMIRCGGPTSSEEVYAEEMYVTDINNVSGECVAGHFFGLSNYAIDKVIFGDNYVEGNAVSKSVVVGRFLDYVSKEHGVEDMRAALESVRQSLAKDDRGAANDVFTPLDRTIEGALVACVSPGCQGPELAEKEFH